jgi:hypothetical protein
MIRGRLEPLLDEPMVRHDCYPQQAPRVLITGLGPDRQSGSYLTSAAAHRAPATTAPAATSPDELPDSGVAGVSGQPLTEALGVGLILLLIGVMPGLVLLGKRTGRTQGLGLALDLDGLLRVAALIQGRVSAASHFRLLWLAHWHASPL